MARAPPPAPKRGHQPQYSDAAIRICLTLKALFEMALRRTMGFVESPLRLVGLHRSVPDFSTSSRRQKALVVNIPCRGSKGPLHLLIDSASIKAEGQGEWDARKHGGTKRRPWRKTHIVVDERTLEIRAVEITGSSIGDAPMLPGLLGRIPADVKIDRVSQANADGACDTRKCHDAVADRGAPAFGHSLETVVFASSLPPCKTVLPWKPSNAGATARNQALRALKYLGRAIWRKWSGYHRRSSAETKMHCAKRRGRASWPFGPGIGLGPMAARCLTFDRQVAERRARAAVLNGFAALGISVTKPVG